MNNTMFRLLRLCLCLCHALLLRVGCVSASSWSISQSRALGQSYALYPLPPFTVTFITTATSMSGEGGNGNPMLASTLSSPLRMLTAEFLLESFHIQMAKSDIGESDISDLVRSMQTLDLQVAVHQVDNFTSEEDEGRQRKLQQRRTVSDLKQYRAEFFTTVAFIEPLDSSKKPSNSEVSELMGGWIEVAFLQDKDYYVNSLRGSRHVPLQQIQSLTVETNSDPIATTDLPLGKGPLVSKAVSTNEHLLVDRWSQAEKTLLAVLLVMVLALLIVSLVIVVRRRAAADRLEKLHFHTNAIVRDDFIVRDDVIIRDDTAIQDDEVLNALEASDRWLSQNRPDLLNIIQQGTSPARDQPQSENGERRYAPPSNPFKYLYGASLFAPSHPPQPDPTENVQPALSQPQDNCSGSAFRLFTRNHEPHRDDNPIQSLDPSDSSSPDSSLTESAVESRSEMELSPVPGGNGVGYVPFRTWLQSQFSFLSYREPTPPPTYEDGLVFVEDLACDEDPSSYSFAYQDFPRQDGTPCLIFQNNEHEGVPSSTPLDENSVLQPSLPQNGQLTDEEFQRALSHHETDASLVADEYEHDSEYEHASNLEAEPRSETENDNSEFLGKLERLIAMRHRHYEKESIVAKHRQSRRRERQEKQQKQQREVQHRDLLLRRHCLELEIQALEADWTPRSDGRQTDSAKKSSEAGKKRHRSISSEPDLTTEEVTKQVHQKIPPIVSIPPRAPLKKSPTSVLDAFETSPTGTGHKKTKIKRSYSFGNLEEKKSDKTVSGRYLSHRRSGSGAEDVMVHGVYAQFV